jgi:hypothetical protein
VLPPPVSAVSAVAAVRFENDKHVMLSYQWDDQRAVLQVKEYLRKRGIPSRMDVDGGMKTDIYDSMAAGVSGSAVVVCFMSQRYQDSENCTLELKYSKKCSVPIVPVMMQGGEWGASDWLGIITAGSLWTPLHDPATFESQLPALVDQILLAAPLVPAAAGTAPANTTAAESEAAVSELDSLRLELAKVTSLATCEITGSLAPVPGAVPPMSLNCRPTGDMMKLKELLLSGGTAEGLLAVSSEKATVGALGMGGIGKTVTASWLARDREVPAL